VVVAMAKSLKVQSGCLVGAEGLEAKGSEAEGYEVEVEVVVGMARSRLGCLEEAVHRKQLLEGCHSHARTGCPQTGRLQHWR